VLKSTDSTQTTLTRLHRDIQTLSGKAILFDGNEVKWSANKIAPFETRDSLKLQKNNVMPTTFPNVAYGNIILPKLTIPRYGQMRKEGIMKKQTFKNGKIAAIGKIFLMHLL
jgi:hypothetical protein